MAPWQKSKLTAQSEKFTIDELLRLQKKLLKIDTEQKTGREVFDLAGELDLLLIDL